MTVLRGAAVILLVILNTAFWGTLVLLGGFLKLIIPNREWRRRARLVMAELGDRWAGGNNAIFDTLLTTRWDISGVETLRADAHYLIISNHRSWIDVFALFRAFHRHAPFIRFFMKHRLMWVPVVGQACLAMDFPFMRRYSAEYVARHPEKRGKDVETTRIACRRYRRIPVAVANFLEGTRFTAEKHADQESPYRHLLRPRIGGIAFVLSSLGEQLEGVIDATIAYSDPDVSVWDFVSNRIASITVRARILDVPQDFLIGNITEPGPERDAFKGWIEGLWQEKDRQLDAFKGWIEGLWQEKDRQLDRIYG